MKVKKLIWYTLAISCMLLVACGKKTDDVKVIEGNGNSEVTTTTQTEAEGYVFSYKGTDIPVDADAAPIIENLGEPKSYFESPSCAAQGIGKLYSYGDFEIETYPDGDTDRVLYVLLKSDAVQTAEGANLASTRDDVIAAYGEPTEEKSGAMIYQKGDMKLKFLFNDTGMVSIEYDSLKN